jgi:hypothetical protein
VSQLISTHEKEDEVEEEETDIIKKRIGRSSLLLVNMHR